MKKIILPLIISLICSHSQAMQQLATQAASRALASTVTPALKESKRTFFSPKKDKTLIDHIPGAKVDYQQMQRLQNKYPHINIPKIYDIQNVSNKKFSQIPGGAMPRLNPLKQGYIIYNPQKFDSKEELDFVMLHELGHIRHQRSIWFMRMSKYGMRTSIILATFFKLISLKYGLLGAWLAPALFWKCYMRFYEEPSADNFAIHYSDKATLSGGKNFLEEFHLRALKDKALKENNQKILNQLNDKNFRRNYKKIINSRLLGIITDHEHPTMKSRINKLQRGLDGTHEPYQMTKLIILMSLVEYSIYLMYHHSKNEESIIAGLTKVKDIEDNFESYCDKWEIPSEGRSIWKYCLETVKVYLQDRLEQIKKEKAIKAKATQNDKDIFIEEALLEPAVI